MQTVKARVISAMGADKLRVSLLPASSAGAAGAGAADEAGLGPLKPGDLAEARVSSVVVTALQAPKCASAPVADCQCRGPCC